MLNSVDLFTGIGGFALAFKGWFKPLVYCEKHVPTVQTLRKRMLTGDIPQATVVDDVCDVGAIRDAVGDRSVHLLTAGFPCVGFSAYGKKRGLEDDQSSLFFDMMAVIRALRPTILFLENVGQILSANDGKDFTLILATLRRAGYVIRWTICSAQDVGSPQVRRRWFALCVRKGTSPPPLDVANASKLPGWAGKCPELTCIRDPSDSRRFSMLGNAVVPLVARLAFARLYSGFRIGAVGQLKGVVLHAPTIADGTVPLGSAPGVNNHGELVGKRITVRQVSETRVPRSATITCVLDPEWFASKRVYQANSYRRPLPPVHLPITISRWPTPRTQSSTHSGLLTARTVFDTPTVVMFAKSLNGVRQPRPTTDHGINPEFVEWLMGFPRGWTDGARDTMRT